MVGKMSIPGESSKMVFHGIAIGTRKPFNFDDGHTPSFFADLQNLDGKLRKITQQ